MIKKRVLVPNDGSQFCRQIYPHLLKLFTPEETVLILLRVGEPPSGNMPLPPRPASFDGTMRMYESHHDAEIASHPIYASQEWDSAVAEIRSEMTADFHLLKQAGYEVEFEARFGDRGEEIVNFVTNNEVDAIAMTTHWRTGIQKLIFGSVAQYVAGHCSVPILMVHPASE